MGIFFVAFGKNTVELSVKVVASATLCMEINRHVKQNNS